MIKSLKIISLFFLTFYIQSSENNSPNSIQTFSSALQLEGYIQTLPAKDQENQRILYLENQENLSRLTSYYRDLAHEFISTNSINDTCRLLIESEFPKKVASVYQYKIFINLLLFEINHQTNIMDFIFKYPADEYSNKKFMTDFINKFKNIERSEKRLNKELVKAFFCIEHRDPDRVPVEVSYFLDTNSSNNPLYPLTYIYFLSKKNKGLV